MPSNVGNQQVNMIYHTAGVSSQINLRRVGIARTGIYEGGWLSIVDASHAQLSQLICEITDGTYQVRVRTQGTVNVAVGSATPYVVLRWVYTGSASDDYMDFLAVASPSTNDLVVGLCTFSGGGSLNGFLYTDRSNPSVKDLFLKVEATGDGDLRVRVRGGYFQNGGESVYIPDQKSDLFTPPASGSKVYLVYVDTDGTLNIDSTGVAAASPVAPDYYGKLVIAEVTISSTDTEILQSQIEDVRPFITSGPREVDGTTIEIGTDGKLKTIDPKYLVMYNSVEQCNTQASWTKLSMNEAKASGISQSNSVITLLAGVRYTISYSVIIGYVNASYPIYAETRLRVISGDSSWELSSNDDNVSRAKYDDGPELDPHYLTLTGSAVIVPVSNTTLQLEALTSGGKSGKSKVTYCSLKVNS